MHGPVESALSVSPSVPPLPRTGVPCVYPESDGQPLAENTLQLRWILVLVGNLRALYHTFPMVFVGGDQFWYPVAGCVDIKVAPDVYVVFGRPKGERSSYVQAEEDNIPLTVIFEIRSPGNKDPEMAEKLAFYERYGAEEYYVYDPERNTLLGYRRDGVALVPIPVMEGHVSPRLGIHFDLSGPELVVYRPDGQPFLTFEELQARYQQAEQGRLQAEQDRLHAERALQQEQQRSARLGELTARVLQGQVTPEELQELRALLPAQPPPAS